MELNREQIIKAMQDCIDRPKCIDCPNLTLCSGHGFDYLLVQALDLIKQLTEENEKIGIENFDLICELSRIKSDTVRKMQERLKEQFRDKFGYRSDYIHELIDIIAKEMLEGAENV